MTDTRPDTPGEHDRTPGPDTHRTPAVPGAWLRFVPPVAALGTAFVLQVTAMTDTVGSALAGQYGPWAYLPALLLGVSVASCAEGGAAYLMDLYDKHLLAGDSVWMLRLSMFVYVGASAGVIHWWTGYRHLPAIISWVLAGMSASALYLWSRGARWRRRDVMRKAGLIDPAMPRFTVAARLMHPVRWLVTVWLISWEPVRTTAEARGRYDAWKRAKTVRLSGDKVSAPDSEPDMPIVHQPVIPLHEHTVRPAIPADTGNVVPLAGRRTVSQPTIDDLADTLAVWHRGQTVGRPKAIATLREVYGSCSAERAIAAKDIHNARVSGQADDADPEPVLTGASA